MTFSSEEMILVAYWILFGLALGIAADLALFAFRPRLKSFFGFRRLTVQPGWGLREVLLLIAFYCLLQFGFTYAAIVAMKGGVVTEPAARELAIVWATLGVNGLTVGFLLFHLRRRHEASWSDLGLDFSSPFKKIALGVFAYFGFLPCFFALVLAGAFVCSLFGIEPKAHPVVELFRTEKSPWILGLLISFAAVAGPVLEEIFFRGFVYPAAKKKWGTAAGLVATAAFFAAVHGNAFQFLPIFGLGLLLTWLYEATGSLLAPMALHALNNTVSVALAFTVLRRLGE